MEPSWQPDPTGRHHYRWWDGAQWTDQVSVDGVVSTDPVNAPPVEAVPPVPAPVPSMPLPVVEHPSPVDLGAPSPAPPAPGPFAGPGGPPFESPVSTPIEPFTGASAAPKRRTGLFVGLGVAAVVVLAGIAVAALAGGGGDGGFGARELELETDDSFVTHELKLSAGDIVRVRLEPSRRLDTVGVVLVDRDLADTTSEILAEDFADVFTDDVDAVYDDLFTDAEDLFSDGDAEGEFDDLVVYSTIDTSFEGDPDADLIVAFEAGTYTLVIQSVENSSNGRVRLIVEKSDEPFDNERDDLSEIYDTRFGSEDSFFTDDDEYTPED